MSEEIEMKLALGRAGPERLCRHPLLAAQRAETQPLANTYFDTPEGDLEAARMALRLRRRGDSRVQTLKTAGDGAGGLSQRGEWEWPVAGADLDREGLAALPPMATLPPGVLERLQPRFATDFTRRAWTLELPEGTVEVALDQGEIRAGARSVPIHELELELEHGAPQALWTLALSFAETVPLRPADASKAARGSALLTGRWRLPPGGGASAWLHRAILALDALSDTGDDVWRAAAREALHALATGGEAEAARLAVMLDGAEWPTIDFGRQALRLAHRLAA